MINELLGAMVLDGKSYHRTLSPTLENWYVYTRDLMLDVWTMTS